MNERLVLLACSILLLSGCSSPSTEKAATDPKSTEGDAATAAGKPLKDDPVVVTDGSVRLLFRSPAFDLHGLSPVYGCCLVTPGVRGKKEVRVYLPATEGADTVKLAKTVALGEQDVVQFYFERKGEGGWTPFDKDKLPSPQLILFRRDLSKAAAIQDAQYADFQSTGKTGWIINAEMNPKAAEEISPLAKSLNMKSEYTVGGKALRLGRLVVRRPDNSAETVTLGTSCSAVEFCTSPNCLAGMNSPCSSAAKGDDK